ncbi:uncharacterized protein Triagg1_3967 [Trichoderma aggressivum f. europaeum]|uniref:Uncharacterized protein n=1 Tax=Trichoderma aggressivum f. europaeum TaxID=173218 RepID=A0AAE1IGG9_9HYPO|nr:hypothetical protein Triagg1_3967 [Trichoderma aggressivum f. europaeum]
MVKRGRPSLNLTPEERVQRRRLQLVASQRKRRAHKRLAQQPNSKSKSKPATESPDLLPVRPDQEALCQFYDAMFSDGDATNASAARKMPSSSSSDPQPHPFAQPHPHPHPHTPPAVCHNCGSAPLDTIALTAVVSAHSPASLMRTSHLRTDTYASSSRLAGPTPSSSAWDEHEYPSATAPDKPGIDQHFFTDEHLAQAYGGIPLLDSILGSLEPLGMGLDGSSLLGGLTPTSNSEAISAPAPAKETENVFLLGRFSTAHNEWMPTGVHEPSYGVEKVLASRRPPSPSPEQDDPNPTLSGDGADLLPPWAGAKQVSLARLTYEASNLIYGGPMSFILCSERGG